MKLLLDERNVIVAISSSIEYGVWGNVGNLSSWRISPTSYLMDNNYSVIEVDEVSGDIRPELYRYENGEFVLNDECPNEYKERITVLEGTVAEQKTSICELTEYNAEMLYMVSMLQLGITE